MLVLSTFCWEMFALTKIIMFPFILFPNSLLAIYLSICTIFSTDSYRWKTQTVYSYPYTYLIHLILSADNVYWQCLSSTVNPEGNQLWILIGRTDAEDEPPILWPPDAKSWLFGKDPDAGKSWRWKEKGVAEDEMVR